MAETKQQENGTSLFKVGMKRLKKDKLAIFGLIIIVIFTLAAIFAPFIANYDPAVQDLLNTYQAPSKEHWLGTDELGRDVFTRLLYGGRVSLSVGLISTGISALFGVFLGAAAGYFGKAVDGIIMRITDIFMCFPFYVIAITVAAIWGSGIWNIMLISGFLNWTNICRIVRAEVLSLRQREYIEAAKALGMNDFEIILKHILPNTFALVIVYSTLGIAKGILSEAGLSYLGLGVTPPQASWGNMLAAAQSLRTLSLYWWLWIPAGTAVFITILSINFFGDGLRDAFDAKMN
jgi:peptide/nickel transport system permease protein